MFMIASIGEFFYWSANQFTTDGERAFLFSSTGRDAIKATCQ